MNPKRTIYLAAFILSAAVCACFLGESYSRYVSQANLNASLGVARWNVALQAGGGELGNTFHMTFRPTAEEKLTGGNHFAPGSSGEASLILDLSETEVAVDYNITVDTWDLEKYFGAHNLDMSILYKGEKVNQGQDTCIPLSEVTKEDSRHEFKFRLTWKNDDSRNASDTDLALSYDTLTLPVIVKVKQHIGGEEAPGEGGISYIETTETIPRTKQADSYAFPEQDALCANPERGFYSTSKIFLDESGLKEGSYVATKSETSNLLHLGVDLSAFSGSMNGTGEDKELTDAAIAKLDSILAQIKQNDNTIILRFVYDNGAGGIVEGLDKMEPSQDMLLKHIGRLKPLFQKYASTINVIQIGFYGLWGEAYYNTDAARTPSHYQETAAALLAATAGTDITVAVRTPEYYTWYRGINIADIENDITKSTEGAYRVGVFNDAYGGGPDDLGTYKDREKETKWLHNQAAHTYYGGEAIPDAGGAGPYNISSYFIPEAFKIHTSYLNWEWNQALHKEWAKQDYEGDDARYQGKKALTYIENHLGYRFVIKEVKTYATAKSGENLPIDITVQNVGFGNLIKGKRADIVIKEDGGTVVAAYSDVGINAKEFLSQTTIKQSIRVTLPALSAGTYQVYLRLSSGETLGNGRWYSAIRFANTGIYDDALQANYIARFKVVE